MKKIGIVGGGIMGMTLALRLSKEGHTVTLFEAAPQLGGLAGAWQIENFTWDKFYHVILLSDSYTLTLLNELGLSNELEWTETKTGFYTNNKLYSMSNTLEFLSFPPLSLIDKLRLGFTIFYASKIKNSARLEKIPVEKWLRRLSGKNTFEKIWLPLLRAKLGENYKNTSAVFIWATIQRMYAARRSGLKKEMFGYVKGGYASIIKAFENKLLQNGVTIKANHQATSISRDINKTRIVFANQTEEAFDKVIITLPSGIAADICSNILTPIEKQAHQNIQYLGVICVSVVLNKPISPYYVTNITDTWVPFTGIIEMSALVDKKYFNNNSLIYLPKYIEPDNPLFDKSDEDIKTEFLNGLYKMYPELNKDSVIFAGVARARRVFVLTTLEYSKSLPSVTTSVPDVFIINAAQITDGTLNVNETIRIADKYYHMVLN